MKGWTWTTRPSWGGLSRSEAGAMRYYRVYLAGRSRDREVARRVNRAAAERIRRRLQAEHPGFLYYTLRVAPIEREKR